MKWFKISIVSILGVIVLIAAALAIAGLGADANRLTSSLVIRQKPAAIWPWLYQSDKVKQWVSWLAEVRDDGKAEPVPGGKSVWVMQDRNNNNAPMEITAVVDSVEPPRKLAVSLSAPAAFYGAGVYTLTGRPDGSTLLESDSRYSFEHPFARFMTPLVIWQAKKKMMADLLHLQSLVETAMNHRPDIVGNYAGTIPT